MGYQEQSGQDIDGVVHDTGAETIAGVKTFTSDPIVPAEVYGAGWIGSNEPPTKKNTYDEIEAVKSTIAGFAADSGVVHNTGAESIAGVKTFTSDPVIPDEIYGSGWNGLLEPPTKNAVYDEMETKADDAAVVHLAGAENITGIKTFTVDPVVPAEAFGVGWNGSNEPPTKNDVYDEMQLKAVDSLVAHLAGAESITGVKTFTVDPIVPAEAYGAGWNGSNEPPTKNDVYDEMQLRAVDSAVVHNTGAESIAGVKTFTSDPVIPDEVYGPPWDGLLEPPTKNAVYDQMELRAVDTAVVHNTGAESIAGVKTFTSDPIIPDESYGVGWNGSLEPATKNAIYDKLESVKVYRAILSQTGTGAPTATIITNTIGEVPTPAYIAVGSYELGLVGTAFTVNKTFVTVTLSVNADPFSIKASWAATNKVEIKTFDAAGVADEIEGDIQILIEVYP